MKTPIKRRGFYLYDRKRGNFKRSTVQRYVNTFEKLSFENGVILLNYN